MSGRTSGERLGSWRLQKKIGEGGNGEVWKAVHDGGTHAALKCLHDKFQKSCHQRFKRFRDEIRTQASLTDYPGVLPVVDHCLPQEPSPSDPAWLVTSMADGLENALGPSASLRDIAEAVASIASTLASLHAKGISHRDVKPSNLYRFNGRWVVGDFGLVDFPDKEGITKPAERLGPAHFIAPEMMHEASESDGAKADVYSLAKTLWALAAGNAYPPPGELRHDSEQLRLSSYVKSPKCAILDRLIGKATRHSAHDRPTMAEFASELRFWLEPPKLRVSETQLNWIGAGELLNRDRERYEEECRERGHVDVENRQINEGIRLRMEELMTDWSRKLGYGLSGGGLSDAAVPVRSNSQYIANASVHLSSPRAEHGRLTAWVGVEREGRDVLHIKAAVGIFHNDRKNLLWSSQLTAPEGTAICEHGVQAVFAQLKDEFEKHIPLYVEQL